MHKFITVAASCVWGSCAVAQMGGGGAYEWHMTEVRSDGYFECPVRYTYLVIDQLSMNDQGAVHYSVRGAGGAQQGTLSPTEPLPQERRIAAALRGAASQPLQQPVAILCVNAQPEDPWFTFGTKEPYAWKKATAGEVPCDGKDGLAHPLVIQLLTREANGLLRYAVRGVALGTSGMMDPHNPKYSQVRLSKLLVAHAGQEVPREGIALCVNAQEDDPLVERAAGGVLSHD